MNLERFARVKLCHRPTPLEPMDRLADFLGGPRLFVKRDDCTGLAIGGNKTRKLEFLMGEALRPGSQHRRDRRRRAIESLPADSCGGSPAGAALRAGAAAPVAVS